MVYNENDPAVIRDREDDYYVPDNQQDIRPQFHKAKKHILQSHQIEVIFFFFSAAKQQ